MKNAKKMMICLSGIQPFQLSILKMINRINELEAKALKIGVSKETFNKWQRHAMNITTCNLTKLSTIDLLEKRIADYIKYPKRKQTSVFFSTPMVLDDPIKKTFMRGSGRIPYSRHRSARVLKKILKRQSQNYTIWIDDKIGGR